MSALTGLAQVVPGSDSLAEAVPHVETAETLAAAATPPRSLPTGLPQIFAYLLGC